MYFHGAAAGRGTLSVGVRAAGQDVKHSIRDLGGGLYKVLFYPRAPIPHKVDVRYNGIPVQGERAVYLFMAFVRTEMLFSVFQNEYRLDYIYKRID